MTKQHSTESMIKRSVWKKRIYDHSIVVECYRVNNHLYAYMQYTVHSTRTIPSPKIEIRICSMRFNENEKKGTPLKRTDEVKRMNERTNEPERPTKKSLEQMGHISLKFMRFKLMRINQNGIRFNFYLNCSAVYSFFSCMFLLMKKLLLLLLLMLLFLYL